jgi:hypothetical protein
MGQGEKERLKEENKMHITEKHVKKERWKGREVTKKTEKK